MYIVEGNIGVGKSTFLNLVNGLEPRIEVTPEPLEAWNNQEFGQSLLAEFYKDIPRWAYTLETLAMIFRVKYHVKESQNPYPFRLMERSVYSGHYCFAQNDYANNNLTDIEWALYYDWVGFMVKQQCRPPKGFIYLKASPDICHKRVLQRARESESALTMDYIKQIHTWHEKFLINKEGVFDNIVDVPVLELDCTENILENKQVLQEHLEKLSKFMGLPKLKNLKKPLTNALTY